MKKFFSLILALVMALSLTTVAWGAPTGTGSASDPWVVADETELKQAFKDGGYVKLGANISLNNSTDTTNWAYVPAEKSVTLDLAGHTITRTANDTFGAIRVLGELIVNDSSAAKTGGISGGDYAIVVGWKGLEGNGAKLTINGGTFTGSYAITGNGTVPSGNNTTNWGTTITINGGTITGTNLGIYHPQKGDLYINGGTISGASGVELRAGTLTISGGDISATAATHTSVANGNGATSTGVAVAVAQHTTKQAIGVTISGGDLSGVMAFAEENPQANSNPAVTIDVTGGDFDGDIAVTDDQSTTISGGTFTDDVSAYVASGKDAVFTNGQYVIATKISSGSGSETTLKDKDGYDIYAVGGTTSMKATKADITKKVTGNAIASDGTVTYTATTYADGANVYVEVDSSVADFKLMKGNTIVAYLVNLSSVGDIPTTTETVSGYVKSVAEPKCGEYSKTLYPAGVYMIDSKAYAADAGNNWALLNGKFVNYGGEATAVPHTYAVNTYNTTDRSVTTLKCSVCKQVFTVLTPAQVKTMAPSAYAQVTADGNVYFIAVAAASSAAPSTDKVTSAQTFDAGIAMYVGMSVMAAAGSAVVLKKREG